MYLKSGRKNRQLLYLLMFLYCVVNLLCKKVMVIISLFNRNRHSNVFKSNYFHII